ncbi:MAG TPA: HEAT repeat domain-containing protein [Gaiellaceae bacterium]|jgi:HEAT repeat protein|nr:HEAT repeat domain-containing protein [Gaiellaceae bacterium]
MAMSPLFLLAGAVVLLIFALVLRRTLLSWQERRRRAVQERLLPAAYELLDSGVRPAGLSQADTEIFDGLLMRLTRLLETEPRRPIADYFESSGAVARECDRLRDRRDWRRATAAAMLGDLGSAAAGAALVRTLGDPSLDVRMAAAHSLGRLRLADGVTPLLEAMAAGSLPRSVGCAAVAGIGSAAVPSLLAHGAGADADGRLNAARLVGQLGDPSCTPALLDWLRDPEPRVRAASAEALERLGDAAAAAALAEVLDDDDADVRVAVASALGYIGGEEVLERLLTAARTDSFEPARAAAEAAARLDPARVATAASDDGGPHLREAADRLALR